MKVRVRVIGKTVESGLGLGLGLRLGLGLEETVKSG